MLRMRNGKLFIAETGEKKAAGLPSINRNELTITIGFLTGHTTDKEHVHKIGASIKDLNCRICNKKHETALHSKEKKYSL